MKRTKKPSRRPLPEKTEQALKEFETILYKELRRALEGNYIVGPNLLVPDDYRQKYCYLTDSSQFPLKGARVSNIKLGQGLPTICVEKDFELAHDEGLCGDSYKDVTLEVALYTLPIYKRVVVVYFTSKQEDATRFETICRQQGIEYVKLDRPSKNRKTTIQQMIGALDAMGKFYRKNHTKKGTK